METKEISDVLRVTEPQVEDPSMSQVQVQQKQDPDLLST